MKRAGNYRRKLSEEEWQQVRTLYREGWNIRQLGDHFGVSRERIWKYLRDWGEPIRPRHSKGSPQVMTNAERDELGITVTLRNQATRELYSFHVPGKRQEALRYVATIVDTSGADWKLLCYSTARTILGDLQGGRAELRPSGQGATWGLYKLPEELALAQIGRLDLLDPSFHLGQRGEAHRNGKP